MFNLIYWPLVGIFALTMILGATLYATILGVALAIAGIGYGGAMLIERQLAKQQIVEVPVEGLTKGEKFVGSLICVVLLIILLMILF